jgi:tetratricopeptide (TPR) repeat protein
MLRPSKKITKRELKQDALISSYAKMRTYYEDNQKTIKPAVAVLVVACIAVIVYVNNRNANNERALLELGKVFELYDQSQYQQAMDGIPERNIVGLRSIVDNYGSSPAGELARFYLANSYFQLGKYDEALAEFEDFSPTGPLLTISRFSGMAACYEAKGNYEDAAVYFEKAGVFDSKSADAAENLNNAARNYGLAGKKERALELYKKLKKDYPATSFGREADRFIAQLSV